MGWGGLPAALQRALKGDDWDCEDEGYLTRIIIDEVGKIGDPTLAGRVVDTDRVGVTTYLTDNEHPILVVNVKKKMVAISPSLQSEEAVFGPLLNETSFEKFVAMTCSELCAFCSPNVC